MPEAGRRGAPRRIRPAEVMRYLGYAGQDLDAGLRARIEETAARCDAELDPRWTWRAFRLEPADGPDALRVGGTPLVLRGSLAARRLAGAEAVALLACTLGAEADRRLRTLGAVDPLAQLVYDAACSDLAEWAADQAQAQADAWARERGLRCGTRFSPGYGDLPLDVQPGLLAVLDAPRRIGLTATRDLLLAPAKSVTAAVGLYPGPPPPDGEPGWCAACALRGSCRFRERGLRCYGAPTGQARPAGRTAGEPGPGQPEP